MKPREYFFHAKNIKINFFKIHLLSVSSRQRSAIFWILSIDASKHTLFCIRLNARYKKYSSGFINFRLHHCFRSENNILCGFMCYTCNKSVRCKHKTQIFLCQCKQLYYSILFTLYIYLIAYDILPSSIG